MTSDVVSLLAELVAINSVNASMPGGPGEAELAQRVAAYGRDLGASVTLEEVLPGRPNVTLTLPGPPEGPARRLDRPRRLLFDVHLDTVPIEGMSEPLSARISRGKMWGRGTCDTKGSLAATLIALRRLAAHPGPRRHEIALLCTVDEEYLKRGVMHVVRQGLSASAAIVGEPTNLRPVVAHKGAVRWRLITHGRAAHTSRPESGNNAVYQMVEVIEELRERLEPALAQGQHPLLSPPTLTVGRIEGGVGVNIVPERCVIEIDRRTLPQEDPEAILAEIDAMMADLMRRREGLRVEREAPFLSERGLETAPDSAVVQALQAACREVLGEDSAVEPEGVPYGTDATHLQGIPTVVFGPGDIAQAHTADEWVDLAQVEAGAEITYRLMRSFAAGDW
ncbi:MAG TPA: M20 family metallopeptidase [Chloroflexota bacterium]|nr:M20 family metallopeptidase [Chloroflexota bacterium]